jgi:flagellar hook-associated protein 2
MSITPLQMTGVSTMSSSLQEVLTRAVKIASLPLTLLQNSDSDTLARQSILSGLGSAALTLGNAVTRLGGVGSGGALSATSSDSALVTVTNNGATSTRTHTISNITSIATPASATSTAFADVNHSPVSVNGKMRVIVDDTPYEITLASNTLTGLQDAINKLGAGVSASIITAGPTSNYLSLTSTTTGLLRSLQILDDPAAANKQTFTTTDLGSNGTAASGITGVFATPDNTPVSSSPTNHMQLVVGSTTYPLTLSDNSLNGLADAINGLAGAGVTASVVGSGSEYSLSITANVQGRVSDFQLTDDPGGANTLMFQTLDLGSEPVKASAGTASYADSTLAHVSATGTMQLNVGSQSYAITLNNNTNNLTGLMAAINGAGAGVTASLGPSNTLTLSADSAGALSNLELVDTPAGTSQQILTNVQLGTNAVFKLDGIDVDHKSNTVSDVVSGMTFNILGTTSGGGKVTLKLATDPTQLSSAISNFVSGYNDMQIQLDQQVGANAGLLTGHGVVRDLQQNVRALAGFSTVGGSIKNLSDMGLTFDASGVLSFDWKVFDALSDSQVQGAMTFFGSSTGFSSLASKFSMLTDPISGTIKLEQDGLTNLDKHLQSQISTLQDRINLMQADMLSRLQTADVLIATLETQQQILSANIQAINLSTYGYSKQ